MLLTLYSALSIHRFVKRKKVIVSNKMSSLMIYSGYEGSIVTTLFEKLCTLNFFFKVHYIGTNFTHFDFFFQSTLILTIVTNLEKKNPESIFLNVWMENDNNKLLQLLVIPT
jgi:hypothetical protein